jgi:hypothetical protein
MRLSTERILTTHTRSLPTPAGLSLTGPERDAGQLAARSGRSWRPRPPPRYPPCPTGGSSLLWSQETMRVGSTT